MPLVKKQDKENQISVGFNMPESLNTDVKNYCEWAGVPTGLFYVTAIEFLLKKDKEWQRYLKHIENF